MIEINSEKPNEWISDLSEEKYHADKTAVSSSSLRLIHSDSEKHFYSRFIKGEEVEQTEPMRLGKMIHLAVLEGDKFTSRYVVEPVFEGLTKDGKMSTRSAAAAEKKAEWYANLEAGALVVTQSERDMIFGIIDSVLSHSDAMAFIRGSQTEVSGYYTDKGTGIRCRIRPDIKNDADGVLGEVKSTKSCKKNDFMWQMIRQGWDFQLAMYYSGMEAINGKPPFVSYFLAVEKVKPYPVAVYVMDIGSLDWAQTNYFNSLKRLKTCIETNTWRPYQDRWEHIAIPEKLMEQPMDEEGQVDE